MLADLYSVILAFHYLQYNVVTLTELFIKIHHDITQEL